MARQLKVPIGFGADLPFGPMPQRGCPRAVCEHREGEGDYDNSDARSLEEFGGDYNGLIDTIEDELCAVEKG